MLFQEIILDYAAGSSSPALAVTNSIPYAAPRAYLRYEYIPTSGTYTASTANLYGIEPLKADAPYYPVDEYSIDILVIWDGSNQPITSHL